MEHFEQLTESSTFTDIDHNVLFDLISDDRLVSTEHGFCVDSSRQEQLVLEAVIKYIKHDESTRIDLIDKFLSGGVRLSLITAEMLQDTRKNVGDFPRIVAALDTAICRLNEQEPANQRSMTGKFAVSTVYLLAINGFSLHRLHSW